MPHVIAACPFFDLREGVDRQVGESFEVTEERMREILDVDPGLVRLDSEKEKPATVEKAEEKPKAKRTTKAAK